MENGTSSVIISRIQNESKMNYSSTWELENIETYLVISQAVNIAILIAMLWIVLSMFIYARRTNFWKSTSDMTTMNAYMMYRVCLASAVLSLPRIIMTQVLFNVTNIPGASKKCEILLDVSLSAYYVSLFSTYFFLWLRQRAMYSHPLLKNLSGRRVKMISWGFIVFVSVSSSCILLGAVIPSSFTNSKYGCIEKPPHVLANDLDRWLSMLNYLAGGIMISSNIILVLLFIYPLLFTERTRWLGSNEKRRAQKRRRRSSDKSFIVHVTSILCHCGNDANRHDIITATIRRSVVSTIIAVFSDVIAAVLLASVIPRSLPRQIRITVYDVSVLINILCIMATFGRSFRILSVIFRSSVSAESSVPESATVSDVMDSHI